MALASICAMRAAPCSLPTSTAALRPLRPWSGFQAALIGLVAGAAWQVTQPALWPGQGYAVLLLGALSLAAAAWMLRRRAHCLPLW